MSCSPRGQASLGSRACLCEGSWSLARPVLGSGVSLASAEAQPLRDPRTWGTPAGQAACPHGLPGRGLWDKHSAFPEFPLTGSLGEVPGASSRLSGGFHPLAPEFQPRVRGLRSANEGSCHLAKPAGGGQRGSAGWARRLARSRRRLGLPGRGERPLLPARRAAAQARLGQWGPGSGSPGFNSRPWPSSVPSSPQTWLAGSLRDPRPRRPCVARAGWAQPFLGLWVT